MRNSLNLNLILTSKYSALAKGCVAFIVDWSSLSICSYFFRRATLEAREKGAFSEVTVPEDSHPDFIRKRSFLKEKAVVASNCKLPKSVFSNIFSSSEEFEKNFE